MNKIKSFHSLLFKRDLVAFYIILLFSIALKVLFFKEYASYNHDIVRDLSATYKMFAYKEWVFRGPVVSDIWVHLSPLYFYFIFPVHYFSNFHPAASAFTTVFVSLGCGVVLYFTLRKFVGSLEALVFFFIYTLSFGITRASGYGLNPNYSLIFSALLVYGLFSLIKGNSKSILVVIVSLSILLSFHASGFFILPGIIITYIWYRPYIGKKYTIISVLIFFILVVLPYALIEKKFDFFNLKITRDFLLHGGGTQDSVPFIQAQINFYGAVCRNIAKSLFYYINSVTIFFSFVLLTSFFYNAYLFFKLPKSKLYVLNFLAMLITSYLVVFSLLIRLKPGRMREWFFQPVFIPLMFLYLSILLVKYTRKRIWFLVLVLTFFFVTNMFAFILYIPPQDTYGEREQIAKFLLKDSNGQEFRVLNTNRASFNYLFWYFEKNPKLKEWHYQFFKYSDRKPSSTVQTCYYLVEKEQPAPSKDILTNLKLIYETKSTYIYQVISCD